MIVDNWSSIGSAPNVHVAISMPTTDYMSLLAIADRGGMQPAQAAAQLIKIGIAAFLYSRRKTL